MIKRTIISALIVVLLVPLNALATSAMSQPSMSMDGATSSMSHMQMAGHDHQAMMSSAEKLSMMDAHDHSEEDCEEYCMSCTNHCSSNAIIASTGDTFDRLREFRVSLNSHTISRTYLFFRPPIRA